MDSHVRFDSLGLAGIAAKVKRGERLTREDGLTLFACPDVTAVGALAHEVRTRRHGDKTYYVVNRHVNYTNVCVNGCAFCAYSRERGQEGGFTLSVEQVLEKLAASPLRPREVHLVGGCHPDLPFAYYLNMIAAVRQAYPGAGIKCFTAVEIEHYARVAGTSTRVVLAELRAAGLDMLPGGGAEIFAPEVRRRICPIKIDAERWLAIHGEAHELGLSTNCTMLFGHLESHEDRVDHLLALRDQQESSGGFNCLIPLPFQTENSLLKVPSAVTGLDILRTIAVSRLLLDNVPHIKAYWVMLTVKLAQVALAFGADDFDGTVVEEKIGHMAGAESEQGLARAELEAMIRGCGFTPVERDALFRPVSRPVARAAEGKGRA